MTYTVKKMAEVSGVSVRTLHFYDEIGLLKPAFVGANGYRYYEEEQLFTLQQILFYRELEFELKEIQRILNRSSFNNLKALKSHRGALLAKQERMQRLLETIDKTIEQMTKGNKMKANELFAGFDPKKQAEHEEYLINRFGDGARKGIEESKGKVKNWKQADWQKTGKEWDAICNDLVRQLRSGAEANSADVQVIVQRHFDWLKMFWTPDKESYAGHGEFIVESELAKAYEAYDPQLPKFLSRAIQEFASRELR